jgi:hypothetical protein
MIAARPCTATFVVGGIAVLVSFYPASGFLRLTDASGRCFQEGRWEGSWSALMAAFRGFPEQPRIQPMEVLGLLDDLLSLGAALQILPVVE